MRRREAVGHVVRAIPPEWLTVACNGMIGRELFAEGDSDTRFYMIGSMGLAASIGLGLALARPDQTVIVFDGDGNVLMNAGVLGSVAAAAPVNFHHVVFDNHSHASTGGQPTISSRVPLDRLAAAAGYRCVARTSTADGILGHFRDAGAEPGPSFLLIDVEPGNEPGIDRVGRPPDQITASFRAACGRRGSAR